MNIKYTFTLLLLTIATNCISGELTWKFVKRNIRHKYPNVMQMTIAELSTTNLTKYLLIDVREEKEYKISHLKNAINLKSSKKIAELVKDKNKQPIILYCSVGYRSSDIASQLISQGITNVYNLEGSIFEWVNSENPVYKENKVALYVHPYNKAWGALLNKKYRKYSD